MEGCIAPSEIPGISTQESSVFGKLAEDLIYADFYSKNLYSAMDIFVDANNPSAYLFFLTTHNPNFTEAMHFDFYARLYENEMMRVPDILVHSFVERVFYEIKPNSISGREAGRSKVGILSATYVYYQLPYTPGLSYIPSDIIVASLAGQVTAKLKVELIGPGLIVYKLCLDSSKVLDLVTLAALLRYIVKKMIEQAGKKSFRPIDLAPAFAKEGELSALARTLGLVMAGAAAAVGWRFFWKAVAVRFAARGALAGLLAASDGPLPVGDLIAAGMAVWTIIDIIRLSDVLWADAAKLAKQEA